MRIKQFWELVSFKVKCDLKAEVGNYALSYLWWAIEPILYFLIFYIVFGVFFKGNSNPDFIPFLFCGIVPWFWFNKSVSKGMDSILKGSRIIKDTYIPKFFFPTVSIITDTFKELLVLLIVIFFFVIIGVYPNEMWLFLPLVIVLQLLLISSIVYLVSIIIPYFLDLKPIIGTGLQMLMYSAGTFYDFKTMPEAYQNLFLLNPIALLINMYRDILIYHNPIKIGDYLYILSFACFFGVLSFIAHKKLDKEVPKVLFR